MLHEERGRAESFGAQAEEYDRTRPGYPSEVFDAVLDAGGPWRVLDVGCGTGIAARAMAERGAQVTGVEVDERMAEIARRSGLEVEVARFEEWDPRSRRFDRVTAAQAWHWVDPVLGPQRAAEALVPGGRLCCIWNIGSMPEALDERVSPIYHELAPQTHPTSVQVGSGYAKGFRHQDHVTAIARSDFFVEPKWRDFHWQVTYTTREWLDLLATHSDHTRLEASTRGELLGRVAAVIDDTGGSFELEYVTYLIEAVRR